MRRVASGSAIGRRVSAAMRTQTLSAVAAGAPFETSTCSKVKDERPSRVGQVPVRTSPG